MDQLTIKSSIHDIVCMTILYLGELPGIIPTKFSGYTVYMCMHTLDVHWSL